MTEQNETKSERFKRVANPRLIKAIKAIQLVGNCSDTGSYEYTDEQIDKLESALKQSVTKVVTQFRNRGATEDRDENLL